MALKWLKRIRGKGELTFYNKASTWSAAVDTAKNTFNNLNFGVKLVETKEEKNANIVILLASGATTYKYYGDTVSTKSDFKGDALHGLTKALVDEKKNEIFFAAMFLPGSVKKISNQQKEVVIVHEFIHACGMASITESPEDHDSSGIMFDSMNVTGNKLIESLHDKDAQPMPPIRVGSRTMCTMQMLWSDKDCKK